MRTWKGTTAGILTIIGGCIGIGVGALFIVGGSMVGWMFGLGWFGAIGGGLLALGILALIGGITTLKRKAWGFSLAGAIFALFPAVPLGVLAIIFVSLAKKEFS